MERNVGGLDRIARVGVGAVFAVVGFSLLVVETLHVAVGATVLLLALALLATAATRRCPVYGALGRNTCERPDLTE